MSPREQLIAYLATLGTLALVFIAALVAVGFGVDGPTVGQAFGLGTITGGLIGILRIPSQRGPVGSTDTGDVNVTTTEKETE